MFGCFEAHDSYLNLGFGLDNLDSKVNAVDGSTWHGMTMKVFISGDYECLSKMAGIAGANGKYHAMYN